MAGLPFALLVRAKPYRTGLTPDVGDLKFRVAQSRRLMT